MERKIYSLFLMVGVLLGIGNAFAGEQASIKLPIPFVRDTGYCLDGIPADLTELAMINLVDPNKTYELVWYDAQTGGLGSTTPPTVSTATAGVTTYYVSQRDVADIESESDRARINVEVYDFSLDFDYESKCGGFVQFTNIRTQTSGDEVIAYSWDFGNEKTSNVMTPSMVYAQPGNYQVVLTAKTAKGCEVSFSKIVDVRYFPSLRIVGPDSVCVGDTAHLELIGAPENCSIVWDNGAGTPSLNVSIPVEGPVSYQASMTDEYQCTYNASITMEVVNCESVDTKDNGADDGCKVWTSALTIYVQGAKDVVEVYDLGGRLVERKQTGDDTLEFTMPQAGAYIVKVGKESVKVDL